MDIQMKSHYIVVLIQSPLALFSLSILALFVFMSLALYITNKHLCIDELISNVYIIRYEVPDILFLHYGIIHCVTTKGQQIKIIDPNFVFRQHVEKISPRELNELKFRIEFKWMIILQLNITITGLETPTLGLKTVRS